MMLEERIYKDHMSYIKHNFGWHDALGLMALILGLLFSGQSFKEQGKELPAISPVSQDVSLEK